MAKARMDLTSFVGKLLEEDDRDILRDGVKTLAQIVMDAEVSEQIRAQLFERAEDRVTQRNGYLARTWDTRVGTIELKIPKLRQGSYFPSLLEPRRRAEKALHAVVVEAYVKGVSTRTVDDLLKSLGIEGSPRLKVSRICKVWTRTWRHFATGPSQVNIPTCGSTPPFTRFASWAEWCRWQPS
jgi:putative transposase